MVSFKHLFVTAKGDGTNTTLVKPSNWNEEHDVKTAADGILLGRAVGAGPGAVQELPLSAAFLPGMVMPYAGAGAPVGWWLCNGASLVRSTNAALFAVIGTTYGAGSNPGSTFQVPYLAGRVIAMGTPGAIEGGPTNTAVTNSAGVNAINFGSPGFVQTSGTVSTAGLDGVATGGGSTGVELGDSVTVSGFTTIGGNFYISVNGTSGAFSIMQPTMYMNYIIKG